MTTRTSNSNRLMLAGAALIVVAGGAYYVGRVYPPRGDETAGTIAPAERYHSAQVQDTDVSLGDNSVPQSPPVLTIPTQ